MNFDQNTMRNFIQQEKRLTAYHEASHAVVAQQLGGLAEGCLWRNPIRSIEVNSWLGNCRIILRPANLPMQKAAASLFPAVPERWGVQVGLAGLAGALIVQGMHEPHEIMEQLEIAFADNFVSATDVGLCGADWSFQEVETLTKLLHAAWPQVKQCAEWLMKKHS